MKDICRDRFAMIYLCDHDRKVRPEKVGHDRMDREDHNDKTYKYLAGSLEFALPELIQGEQASNDPEHISKEIDRAGPEK